MWDDGAGDGGGGWAGVDCGAVVGEEGEYRAGEGSVFGAVHLAAAGGHVEVLRLLLVKGACVDALSKDGDTALHLAVQERRRDCARLLLANGAKPDVRNAEQGGLSHILFFFF